MLDADDIPTPLLLPGERPPIEIRSPEAPRFRSLHVARKLVGLLARVGGAPPREAGRAARETLAEVGGLWAKVGQMISSAHAAFPGAFLFELMQLHHRSAGFEPAQARRVIEEELGRSIDWIFLEFDDRPIGAGSIGQVHRAVLREGRRDVVVKVQRPGVSDLFRRDLAILGRVLGVLRRIGRWEHLRLGEMQDELGRACEEELDYRRELENLKTFRKNLEDHGIYVPEPFERYSTRRVLVVEHIEGVFLSDLLDVMDRDPDRARTWLDATGVEPRKVARKLYRSLLRQALEEGLFHGEPGAGNVVLLRENRIALLDAGAIGRLYPDFRRTYTRFLRSVLAREYKDAIDRFIRFFQPIPPVDLDQLKKDLLRVFRSWDAATRIRELPYGVRSMSSMWARIGQVCVSYRIPLEWYYSRLDRAFLALDVCLRYLHEEIDFHVELAKYFRAARRREFLALPRQPGPLSGLDLHDLDLQIEDLGNDLADIVRRSSLDFESTGNKLAAVVALAFRRLRLVSLLAGGVLLLVAIDQLFLPIRLDPNVSRVAGVIESAPRLSGWDWAIAGLLFAFVHRMIGRVTHRMTKKESQYRSLIQ